MTLVLFGEGVCESHGCIRGASETGCSCRYVLRDTGEELLLGLRMQSSNLSIDFRDALLHSGGLLLFASGVEVPAAFMCRFPLLAQNVYLPA